MNKHFISIEIQDGKVKEILDRLDAAQKTIRDCYYELESLGVLNITKETASGN